MEVNSLNPGDISTLGDELDAMTAAPDHHTVLLENERVRVLDSLVKPGDSTPIHTHSWPGVLYILGFSDFDRKDADGRVIFDSQSVEIKPVPGQALWSGPLEPHSVTNLGAEDIRVISVELKDGL